RLRDLPLPPRLARMVVDGAAAWEGALAADVALVLTERGLGGNDVDLAHRLDALRRDRSARARDARAMAKRWVDSAGAERGGDAIIARQRRSVPSPREPLRAVGRDRVGGGEARWDQSSANKAPPTPDPSPPLTAFAGGGEPREPSRGEKETRERSKEQRGLT